MDVIICRETLNDNLQYFEDANSQMNQRLSDKLPRIYNNVNKEFNNHSEAAKNFSVGELNGLTTDVVNPTAKFTSIASSIRGVIAAYDEAENNNALRDVSTIGEGSAKDNVDKLLGSLDNSLGTSAKEKYDNDNIIGCRSISIGKGKDAFENKLVSGYRSQGDYYETKNNLKPVQQKMEQLSGSKVVTYANTTRRDEMVKYMKERNQKYLDEHPGSSIMTIDYDNAKLSDLEKNYKYALKEDTGARITPEAVSTEQKNIQKQIDAANEEYNKAVANENTIEKPSGGSNPAATSVQYKVTADTKPGTPPNEQPGNGGTTPDPGNGGTNPTKKPTTGASTKPVSSNKGNSNYNPFPNKNSAFTGPTATAEKPTVTEPTTVAEPEITPETGESSVVKIPASSTPIKGSGSSGSGIGGTVIPVVAGVSAAAAAGVGAKVYMDRKNNNDNGEYDDIDTEEWSGEDTIDLTEEEAKKEVYLDEEDDYGYQEEQEKYGARTSEELADIQ